MHIFAPNGDYCLYIPQLRNIIFSTKYITPWHFDGCKIIYILTPGDCLAFHVFFAGTHLCMNSPVDPALLQLVQQELKSLEGVVNNMSVEFEEEKRSVQCELQNVAIILEEMKHRMQRLETGQQNLECRTDQVESRIGDLEGIIVT